MTDKTLTLGQKKVGIPHATAIDAVLRSMDEMGWQDINRQVVVYYLDGMMSRHVFDLIDQAVPESELNRVEPEQVMALVLILLRDFFRHKARKIRPVKDTKWVEEVFNRVAKLLLGSTSMLDAYPQAFDLDNIQDPWSAQVAEPLGLQSVKLFACHSAIVTGV